MYRLSQRGLGYRPQYQPETPTQSHNGRVLILGAIPKLCLIICLSHIQNYFRRKIHQFSCKTHKLCPPPKGRGTYMYWFGADPVGFGVSIGVGVSVTLSCLHDISTTSGWILIKFAWM